MTGQEKYKEWKASHKVNMRVYTDEDMFVMGFDSRNEQVDALLQLVEDLAHRVAELSPKKKSEKKT